MTTITATMTVKLAGADAASIALIAESLRTWLAQQGGRYLQEAILDNAPPEYPDEDEDEAGNPTFALLVYDAWTSDDWRIDVTVGDVGIQRPQGAFLCVVCGENPVDPEDGFDDTCASCAERV